MRSSRTRILPIAAVLSLFLSAPAAYAAPVNDDFDQATAVTAIPYSDAVPTGDATVQYGEPFPCGGRTGRTVWYRLRPDEDRPLVADTFGSDFATTLAVYTGTSIGDLHSVACDSGYRSSVSFEADAGKTYWFQIGGYDEPSGIARFNLAPPGSIEGAVLDETGAPLSGICVQAASGAPFRVIISETSPTYRKPLLPSPWPSPEYGDYEEPYPPPESPFMAFATTDHDGRYRLGGLAAIEYSVVFYDCRDYVYATEWYDDARNPHDAEPVDVAPGAVIEGIDATLEPWRLPDPAVTDLSVQSVPVTTDAGDLPVSTGWNRRVEVEVSNLGDGPSTWSSLVLHVCPRTFGSCRQIRKDGFGPMEPGETAHRSLDWNGLGMAGDVTVTATVLPGFDWLVAEDGYYYTPSDADWSNNERSVEHYVIAGGTGVGVGSGLPDEQPIYPQ